MNKVPVWLSVAVAAAVLTYYVYSVIKLHQEIALHKLALESAKGAASSNPVT